MESSVSSCDWNLYIPTPYEHEYHSANSTLFFFSLHFLYEIVIRVQLHAKWCSHSGPKSKTNPEKWFLVGSNTKISFGFVRVLFEFQAKISINQFEKWKKISIFGLIDQSRETHCAFTCVRLLVEWNFIVVSAFARIPIQNHGFDLKFE